MKKAPFLGKLRLLLLVCCSIILAVLIYRQYLGSTRLESVLSFADLELDECIIGRIDAMMVDGSPKIVRRPTIRIKENQAQEFAKLFTSIIRKYGSRVRFRATYELAYPRQIIFKNKGLTTCEFRFTYLYEDETLIDYRTKNPFLMGTMIIKKRAGAELEALIESFAIEEAEKNQE